MRKGSEDPSLAWGAGTLNHRWPLRLPPVFVDAAHLGSVGTNITAATTLGMAQHHEEAASDVNNLQIVLICFLQDRQIAVFRREGDHAGQGRDLPEPDRVDVTRACRD